MITPDYHVNAVINLFTNICLQVPHKLSAVNENNIGKIV